jgi:hypothetical protein
VLAHRRAVDWCKSQALHCTGIGVVFDNEREAFAIELARTILANSAVLTNPELLSLMARGIVGVETLAMSAANAGPVLEDRATAAH